MENTQTQNEQDMWAQFLEMKEQLKLEGTLCSFQSEAEEEKPRVIDFSLKVLS